MEWKEFQEKIKEKYPKVKITENTVEFSYDLLYFSFYKDGDVYIQEYEEGVYLPNMNYEKMLVLFEVLYHE